MNSRERVMSALSGGYSDRVPVVEPWINQSVLVELAKLLRIDTRVDLARNEVLGEETLEVLDLYCEVVHRLGLDATSTKLSLGMSPIGGNLARDKYGTTYQLSEHGEPLPVTGPIEDSADLRGYNMVSKIGPEDFKGVRHVIARSGSEVAHFVTVPSPFKTGWRLRGGMQRLLMDYVCSPELVHELARIAVEFCKRAIELALEISPDAIIILEGDVAEERGLLISPAHYREYIHPYYEETVSFAHNRGAKVVKHTDGNAWAILEDLVSAGFDAFHPVQPQCMDIEEVKQHLAGRMCIIGNIDCRNLLPFGTLEEVVTSVRETLRIAAPGGGYMISSSNSIHPAVNPRNYLAMVKTALQYGVYNPETGGLATN